MKRIKVLVLAATFAVMAIGGAAASAQYILEEPIIVTRAASANMSDDFNANNTAQAEETPAPTPAPTRRPTGGGGMFLVSVQYQF